jgi:hypothetical protein
MVICLLVIVVDAGGMEKRERIGYPSDVSDEE